MLKFIFVLGGLVLLSSLAAQDPFRRGSRNSAEPQESWYRNWQQRLTMPPWFRKWQAKVQAQVSTTALKIKDGRKSWQLYLLGFVLATVFGFLHIAGPGHGKIFTISYFMSRQAKLPEGLWLSALINLVDSLSAGLVVFLVYGILSLSQRVWVEAAVSILSYGIIVLWSIWHLGSHFRKRGCCHHKAGGGKPAWYFALGIGLVPCPVSTALLIFGLLNRMLGIAIFLVIGVSLGGMIAMTLLSFAIIGGKKGIFSLILTRSGPSKLPEILGEVVEISALLLMAALGILLLLLSFPR